MALSWPEPRGVPPVLLAPLQEDPPLLVQQLLGTGGEEEEEEGVSYFPSNMAAHCCNFQNLFNLNLHDPWDNHVYPAVHPALLQRDLL